MFLQTAESIQKMKDGSLKNLREKLGNKIRAFYGFSTKGVVWPLRWDGSRAGRGKKSTILSQEARVFFAQLTGSNTGSFA